MQIKQNQHSVILRDKDQRLIDLQAVGGFARNDVRLATVAEIQVAFLLAIGVCDP